MADDEHLREHARGRGDLTLEERGRRESRRFPFGAISPSRIESDRRATERLLLDVASMARLTAATSCQLGSSSVSPCDVAGRDRAARGAGRHPKETAPEQSPQARPAAAGRPLTCVVADDHPIVAEAIARVLAASRITVVGRVRTGTEALGEIERRRPSVALVDLRLPSLSGIEVARRARRAAPETAVVLYTGAGPALLGKALGSGARGFLLKEAPVGDVPRALRMVAEGHVYIDPALAGFLIGSPASRNLDRDELEILRLLAEGLTTEAVGARLFLSPDTIRGRVRKLMRKLGAQTRTEAVATAIRQRLIA